jgi:hypothetical protein
MSAKQLILARLSAAPTNPEPNAPALGANARRANPLLISEASEQFSGVTRPDASTIANAPGAYYGRTAGPAGNTVSDAALSTISTRNGVDRNTRTSPAGAPRSPYGTE